MPTLIKKVISSCNLLLKQTFLSRIKVFYQVLILILVMVAFLAFQGNIGLKIINNMHQMTLRVFDQSVRGQSDIFNAKLYVEQIKSSYLAILAGEPGSIKDSLSSLEEVIIRIRNLESIERNQSDDLVNSFEELKLILKQPVSSGNYSKLQSRIDSMMLALNILDDSTRDFGLQTLSLGTTYSVSSRRNTFALMLISGLIALALGLMIASSISQPLKRMEKAAQDLAIGNLSNQISIKGCAEVSGMANALNQAIKGLRDLVSGTTKQARVLFKASEELKTASSETGQSASQVAQAMEELAEASTEQTNQISQTVEKVNQLAELVRNVSGEIANIAASSRKVIESAQLGQKATNDVANAFNGLYHSTQEVGQVITILRDTSSQIGEITSLIGGIAEQTTLLALNASIEAARAGEHGKGFSVVAKETGKLADQSKQAADLINDLIMEMRQKTEHAVEVIQSGIERANSGKNLVSETNITFGEIFETLINNMARIDTVAHSAKLMAENNESMINAITTVASISEETMASTEEVSATTQEQSALVKGVSTLADNLSQVAGELQKAVAVFDIGINSCQKSSKKSDFSHLVNVSEGNL